VEAVANVVGQAELMAALAVLGACYIHVSRPALRPERERVLATATLFAAGLLVKENAIVLAALLPALDIAERRFRLTRDAITRSSATSVRSLSRWVPSSSYMPSRDIMSSTETRSAAPSSRISAT
jgi:hypothetical protein